MVNQHHKWSLYRHYKKEIKAHKAILNSISYLEKLRYTKRGGDLYISPYNDTKALSLRRINKLNSVCRDMRREMYQEYKMNKL